MLVIDDERPLAGIVASYLSKAGFDTALAFTGPDGVRSAQELDPDVIILDLGLPGIDGIEVCRQIRLSSDCYILMLTARADEVDKLIGLVGGRRRLPDQAVQPPRARRPRQHRAETATPPGPRHTGRTTA